MKKAILYLVCLLGVCGIYQITNPVLLEAKYPSSIVLDKDGNMLRSFADQNGVWRYPINIDGLSQNYLDALIQFEDQYYYQHYGVNPFALVRAVYQRIRFKKIISGGSTLTMQVARMVKKPPRTIFGKMQQMVFAVQLEWRYSKKEILQFYVNHAPFGGTFEGVNTASLAYFGHDAKYLTDAQAALLAVLPQAPSKFRPDKHPDVALLARNKLIQRMLDFNLWSKEQTLEALQEDIVSWPHKSTQIAPLFSRKMHGDFTDQNPIYSTIDINQQVIIESLVKDYVDGLPNGVSAAVLVAENKTGNVTSYVGSADFQNNKRFAYVDMVQALRSPGSTLKPFIYGMALDEGLIHSESLLMDVPISFDDYQPVNFHREFSGPVSAAKALKQSLNLPAVQLLDHLKPQIFYANLANQQFLMKLPYGGRANISMALGGFSSNLENLVYLYTSLGNKGQTSNLVFSEHQPKKTQSKPLLSEGAAWIVYQSLLADQDYVVTDQLQWLAIKTGTSYGFRDAWAIGVANDFTIGVWLGKPDGIGVAGNYGSQSATPLLEQIVLNTGLMPTPVQQPDSVNKQTICWPGGQNINKYQPPQCQKQQNAWVLDSQTPNTLAPRQRSNDRLQVQLNLSDTNHLVSQGCPLDVHEIEQVQLWPAKLEPWLDPHQKRASLIKKVDPRCGVQAALDETVEIMGIDKQQTVALVDQDQLILNLFAQGGFGPWYWFVNGKPVYEGERFEFKPKQLGQHQILLIDQSGQIDRKVVDIQRLLH